MINTNCRLKRGQLAVIIPLWSLQMCCSLCDIQAHFLIVIQSAAGQTKRGSDKLDFLFHFCSISFPPEELICDFQQIFKKGTKHAFAVCVDDSWHEARWQTKAHYFSLKPRHAGRGKNEMSVAFFKTHGMSEAKWTVDMYANIMWPKKEKKNGLAVVRLEHNIFLTLSSFACLVNAGNDSRCWHDLKPQVPPYVFALLHYLYAEGSLFNMSVSIS